MYQIFSTDDQLLGGRALHSVDNLALTSIQQAFAFATVLVVIVVERQNVHTGPREGYLHRYGWGLVHVCGGGGAR